MKRRNGSDVELYVKLLTVAVKALISSISSTQAMYVRSGVEFGFYQFVGKEAPPRCVEVLAKVVNLAAVHPLV